jgi:hypothetical protein
VMIPERTGSAVFVSADERHAASFVVRGSMSVVGILARRRALEPVRPGT